MSSSHTQSDLLNGFIKLKEEKLLPGQNYLVLVWMLTEEIGPKGERGFLFPVCVCSSIDNAKSKAIEISKKYNLPKVQVIPFGQCEQMDNQIRPETTIYTEPPGLTGNLKSHWQFSHNEKPIVRDDEKQAILEEIEQERLIAQKEGTIEHYTRLWYLIIRNKDRLIECQTGIKHYDQKYKERIEELRKAHEKHPEYEDEWLTRLKPKLKKRGEEHILEMLQNQHSELKSIIFDK